MRVAGLDIGSRTVKLAVVEDGTVLHTAVTYNTHDPVAVCNHLLEGVAFDRVVSTGYGRHLIGSHLGCEALTEIRAASLGARHLLPTVRTLLDIGGQDTKVISLDADGRLQKFEMNDKCAAGTGRFLEVMAVALSYDMGEFVDAALTAPRAQQVAAMCTVFAESEVIGAVARQVPRDELALGLHQSVARRALGLLRRIPVRDDVLFCGGGARNAALVRLVREGLDREVHVPADPQVVAAMGAALEGPAPPPGERPAPSALPRA